MSGEWFRNAKKIQTIYQEMKELAEKRKRAVDKVYSIVERLADNPVDETLRTQLVNELKFEEEIIEKLENAVDDARAVHSPYGRPQRWQVCLPTRA